MSNVYFVGLANDHLSENAENLLFILFSDAFADLGNHDFWC